MGRLHPGIWRCAAGMLGEGEGAEDPAAEVGGKAVADGARRDVYEYPSVRLIRDTGKKYPF